MLSYRTVRGRPRVVQGLTGLSLAAFEGLAERLAPAWQEAEQRRLSARKRHRAVGAGRRYKLTETTDKLLLFLSLCRHNLTYELAGFLFGLDTSNARRLFLRVAPAVEAAADPELASFLQQARRVRKQAGGGTVGTWEAFVAHCPELAEVAVDTTESPRQRPGTKRGRKRHYSGKKKRFTVKTGVVVGAQGRIVHVSAGYPGPTHDKTLYEAERLHDLIPKRTRQFLDSAYQGLGTLCPEHDLRLPFKRPSPGCKGRGQAGPPLTRGQKQANGLRRRRRVVVENRLAVIKSYRLLAETWRSRDHHHNPVFRAVAAVTNYRLAA